MELIDFEEFAKTMPNIDHLCDEIEKVERNGNRRNSKIIMLIPNFVRNIKIDYKHLLNALNVILRQVSAI